MSSDRLPDVLRRLPQARKALHDALGDMPSRGGTEGVSGGGTGEWGPTVSIALSLDRDTAWRDWEALNALDRIRNTRGLTPKQTATFCDLVDMWAPPARRKQKLEENLRAAAGDDLNRRGDPNNCPSCARVGAWGDIHARGLCKRCDRLMAQITDLYDHTLELPPRELVSRRYVRNGDIINAMHGHTRRTP